MFGSVTIRSRRLVGGLRLWARQKVRRVLRKLIEIVITDLDMMARLRDLTSSVEFEADNLMQARTFRGRMQLLRWAAEQLPDDNGLHLEFGVYKADSINLLADVKRNVTWYGFDSFIGLPEDWNLGSKAGAFSIGGRLPPVRRNVKLIKGFFETTLPAFVAEHRGEKVALLHIDCDIYSSTRTVLFMLKDMLVPGSIIVFDELINYPGWQDHEYRAFMEFVVENDVSFEYIGYVRTSSRVAVRLIAGPTIAPDRTAIGEAPALAP